MHPDIQLATTLLYDALGLQTHLVKADAESLDYNAHTFKLNNAIVNYRAARITPTKVGQFVTLWKRTATGTIAPLDSTDAIDFFIVNVNAENKYGQFIFTKQALITHGILTHKNKEGKRALRVYPPWDLTVSPQAIKTQAWQTNYFIDLTQQNAINFVKAKEILKYIIGL